MARATWIIRDEHAHYGSVLGLVRGLLTDPAADERSIDTGLLALALDYVAEFVATFHHPKEDRYLFRLLRERAPDMAGVIDALAAEHQLGDRKLTALRVRLEALQRRPSAKRFLRFKADALAYIDFETKHAMRETRELLPVAERVLSAADWAVIDAAFADNDDPAFGARPRQRFDRMLSAIANRAASPYGLAAPATITARWPWP
jgi:hemerythrin-like domain-containing protein